MRGAIFWILFTVLLSALLTGWYTRFEYDNLDIQLHDTYFVFDPAVIFALQVAATTLSAIAVSSTRIFETHRIAFRLVAVSAFSVLLIIPLMILYVCIGIALLSK